MDPILPTANDDPEFGNYGTDLLRGDLGDSPEVYLRLIANPFLAFTFCVAWLAALYQTVIIGFAGPLTPMLVLILLMSLLLLPRLTHFHCLDCGATGSLPRWRKHTCAIAHGRRESGQARYYRGPTPPIQVVCWIWALMALAVVLNGLQFLTE